MVVHQQDDVDRVFAALVDATRHDIVARVMKEEASVSVLERAGLVHKQARGRERIVRGDVDTIRAAARLLDHYEEIWRGRLGRLEDLLSNDPAPRPGDPP